MGLAVAVISCPDSGCTHGQLSAIGGILLISSFVIIPISLASWIYVRISSSRAKRAEEQRVAALRTEKEEDLSKEKILVTQCPSCGAPLDISSGLSSYTNSVVCQYCGNAVQFRG